MSDGFELRPGEQKVVQYEGSPARYERILTSQKISGNTFSGWGGYWVSDDGKEWSLWCPCVERGKPVCEEWRPNMTIKSAAGAA